MLMWIKYDELWNYWIAPSLQQHNSDYKGGQFHMVCNYIEFPLYAGKSHSNFVLGAKFKKYITKRGNSVAVKLKYKCRNEYHQLCLLKILINNKVGNSIFQVTFLQHVVPLVSCSNTCQHYFSFKSFSCLLGGPYL